MNGNRQRLREKDATRFLETCAAIESARRMVTRSRFNQERPDSTLQACLTHLSERRRTESFSPGFRLYKEIIDKGAKAAVLHTEVQRQYQVTNRVTVFKNEPDPPEGWVSEDGGEGTSGGFTGQRVTRFLIERCHEIHQDRDIAQTSKFRLT